MVRRVRPTPDQSVLRDAFDYDPLTGVLTRKSTGLVAGSRHCQGYVQVGLNRENYLAHRLIWKWMTGREAPYDIDHRDRNRSNNRWKNLRDATWAESRQNTRAKGVRAKGVDQAVRNGKYIYYRARIGKELIGYFRTEKEAADAYAAAAKLRYGEFACHD